MLITLLLLLLLLRRTATGAEHSVRYVDVLSTRVNVTDPVCDLGVMINSQLSLSGLFKSLLWASRVTTRSDNFAQSSNRWQQPPQLPMNLSDVAWTTVTHCSAAFSVDCFNICSRFRMSRLSLEYHGATILPEYYISCTGYWFVSGFCLKLLVLFSSHWTA